MQSEEMKQKWMRVAARRKQDAQLLKSQVLERILDDSQARGYLVGNSMEQNASNKVEAAFKILFEKTCDSQLSSNLRRKSFDLLETLRRQLDEALKVPENLAKEPSTSTTAPAPAPAPAPTNTNESVLDSTETTSSQAASTTKQPLTPASTKPVGPATSRATTSRATTSRATTSRATTSIANLVTASVANSQSAASSLTEDVSGRVTAVPASTTAAASNNSSMSVLDSTAIISTQAASTTKQSLTPVPAKPVGPAPSKARTSIASLVAASVATSQLAASSITDNIFGRVTTIPTSTTAAVSNNSKKSNQTVLPTVAPPPYQRYSGVVVQEPAAISKKRVIPLDKNLHTHDENKRSKTSESTPMHQQPPPKKVSKSTPIVPRPPPFLPVLALDIDTQRHTSESWVHFPPDLIVEREVQSRWSGSRVGRPPVALQFVKQWPGNKMLASAGAVLRQWEPFWHIERVVAVGVTSPVSNMRWIKAPTWKLNSTVKNIPRTAASFEIPGFTGDVLRNIGWGTSKINATNTRPNNGDIALVMQMLPITIDRKYKRANCHLWPKGTFLTVNGLAVALNQRRQAGHDPTKWDQMSHPLDLSGQIRRPRDTTSITVCCQDESQYLYMVAVCSYKSPLRLLDELLQESNPYLIKLSLEESTEKAMQYMNKNSMINIDGLEGDSETGVGKLVFSLVDPVTKVPMKTPTRGQRCKHWQCFDLESFLTVNVPVAGGRWRCVCCESFITYQELEVCGLAKEALRIFAREVSATRDRVEFRADKSFHLLKEPPLRHNNRFRRILSANGSNNDASGHPEGAHPSSHAPLNQPIEIIDLDD